MIHWLYVWIGLSNASGSQYLFWSGIFGDLTIFTGGAVYLAHSRCHSRGCWRTAKHQVDGTPWKVCRKCHPVTGDKAPTRAEIHKDHRRANQ